jgi:3-oxoacyl-[acyl-carrier protein] reductase
MPVRPLLGQTVLVTGGSRGIGWAIASAMAEAGANVVLAARTAAELDGAVAVLRGRGTQALGVAGDVSDAAFCRELVARVEVECGSLDVLVNNAGVQGPIGPLETVRADEWLRTFAINLHAAVWLMQSSIPGMKRRGGGSIINLSGGGATGPRERFAAYSASKAALVRLTETAARELREYHIRVNAIAPGAVNTRMTVEAERAGPAAGARAQMEVAQQRASGGTPPELAAELAVFLASQASADITGRLLSAVWDDWRGLRDGLWRLDDDDVFTLRRIPARISRARES